MEKWSGTFEMVDPREIKFDRTKYQRHENWPLIGSIASNPRWESFAVIPCAKRIYAGGAFWAYDGQQRLLGVLSSSSPPATVPVVWWPFESRADEAATFIDVNVNRKAVSALDKFKAQIGAENPTYLTIARVVEEAGYTLAINGDTAKSISAVGALQGIYNEAGELGLLVALQAIESAWPDEKQATSYRMLALLAQILGEMNSNGGIKQEKLVAALRRTTPGHITRKAKDIRHDTDCSVGVSMRRAFKQVTKL